MSTIPKECPQCHEVFVARTTLCSQCYRQKYMIHCQLCGERYYWKRSAYSRLYNRSSKEKITTKIRKERCPTCYAHDSKLIECHYCKTLILTRENQYLCNECVPLYTYNFRSEDVFHHWDELDDFSHTYVLEASYDRVGQYHDGYCSETEEEDRHDFADKCVNYFPVLKSQYPVLQPDLDVTQTCGPLEMYTLSNDSEHDYGGCWCTPKPININVKFTLRLRKGFI